MKIFKLTTESQTVLDLNEKHWKSTVDCYEKETHKRSPYYCNKKEKTRHFAVCPGCNNPVQIINLYDDGTQSPHAKHQGHSILGIAMYSQEKYDTCELRQRTPFSDTEKNRGTEKSNEILRLIREYPDILYKHIRNIMGINFSRRIFEHMIDNFLHAEGHCYKYINKFNLPFAFLYMQKSTRIINQHILKNHDHSKEIVDNINNSKYFTVAKHKIEAKNPKGDGFVEIDFYLTKHKVSSEVNRITLRITESKNRKIGVIFEKEIEINQSDYMNDINDAINSKEDVVDENSARYQLREMVSRYIND